MAVANFDLKKTGSSYLRQLEKKEDVSNSVKAAVDSVWETQGERVSDAVFGYAADDARTVIELQFREMANIRTRSLQFVAICVAGLAIVVKAFLDLRSNTAWKATSGWDLVQWVGGGLIILLFFGVLSLLIPKKSWSIPDGFAFVEDYRTTEREEPSVVMAEHTKYILKTVRLNRRSLYIEQRTASFAALVGVVAVLYWVGLLWFAASR
jgi:hypothetical protein